MGQGGQSGFSRNYTQTPFDPLGGSPGGATSDPYTPTDGQTTYVSPSGTSPTSVGSIRRKHGKGDPRGARPGRGPSEGGMLSGPGRIVVGVVVGAVLGKAFDWPGGWALGGAAGGAVAYFGGELWMTR